MPPSGEEAAAQGVKHWGPGQKLPPCAHPTTPAGQFSWIMSPTEAPVVPDEPPPLDLFLSLPP